MRRKSGTSRGRIVVLAVPPVDEFDLVCPIQVFGAANRLAGKTVYNVEVATAGKDLKVRGEGGLLSFLAGTHYKSLDNSFDSSKYGSRITCARNCRLRFLQIVLL